MPAQRICVLSSFDADIRWLGRDVAIRSLLGGLPARLDRRCRLIISDVEALVPIMRAPGRSEVLDGLTLLLIDSMGPARLPLCYAEEIRRRRNVVLAYGIRGHRAGYLRRGIPAKRLVWMPAALTYFPIMMPDYQDPHWEWQPPPVPRVFCGGRNWRDWETLKQAAELIGLPIDVVTDLGRVNLGDHPRLVPHDRIPFGAFCRALARSSCAVLPLMPGRCAGQATLLLAMHMGVPTIATAIPAMREYVRHGRDGLLVKSRDPHSLATAIRRLLDDRRASAAISVSAREAAHAFEQKAAAILETIFTDAGV